MLLVFLVLICNETKLSRSSRISCLLLAFGLLAFNTASFDSFYAIFFLIISIFGNKTRMLFKISSFKALPFLFALLIIIIASAFANRGLLNQSDDLGQLIYFLVQQIDIINYLWYRYSIFISSTIINFSDPEFYMIWYDGLLITLEGFYRNFLVIIGQDYERDYLANINVLNKNLIAFQHGGTLIEKEGTSPGLLSSFFFIAPFPIAIFLTYLLVNLITNSLDRLFAAEFNLLLSVCLIIIFFGILNSPAFVFTSLVPTLITSLGLILVLIFDFNTSKK